MQNPDVTALIQQQSVAFQPIYKALRQTILQAAPHITEFMQYGIPFYDYHGRLCYLNLRQRSCGARAMPGRLFSP